MKPSTRKLPLLVFAMLCIDSHLALSDLPHPDPVFNVATFVSPNFGTDTSTYQQPSFQVGNKAVFVRKIDGKLNATKDQIVTVYIDDKEVGRFKWWGAFKNGGFSYSFLKNNNYHCLLDNAFEYCFLITRDRK